MVSDARNTRIAVGALLALRAIGKEDDKWKGEDRGRDWVPASQKILSMYTMSKWLPGSVVALYLYFEYWYRFESL